ncbi:MAG: DMT family transporter [Pigmentiphaga sp.]|nr:DMT family transporter [Pigmentiphaga sp.]
MAALAVFSTLGLTFVTQAFRLAPPAVVAPFDYSGLIWAALFGWIFWGEALDAWTYVGAGLIAAGGILVVTRQPRGDEHVAASEERCSRNNEAGGSKADALPQVGKCQNCD